jgi:hypothetical protein
LVAETVGAFGVASVPFATSLIVDTWRKAVRPTESTTCTVKVKTRPAVVGVPEMVPVLESIVSPLGRLPLEREYEYGEDPPDVTNPREYADPTTGLKLGLEARAIVGVAMNVTANV